MATQVGNNQTIGVTATPVKTDGTAGSIEAGSAKWASSDVAIADVAVDPANELAATVTPVAGAIGTATITLTGDADLGAGVVTITGAGDVEVIDGQASGFTLSFGNPSPKP